MAKAAPSFIRRALGIILLLSTVWLTTCQSLVGTLLSGDDSSGQVEIGSSR